MVTVGAASVLIGENLYMYGGRSGKIEYNLYAFNMSSETWSKCDIKGKLPQFKGKLLGRYGHTMHEMN